MKTKDTENRQLIDRKTGLYHARQCLDNHRFPVAIKYSITPTKSTVCLAIESPCGAHIQILRAAIKLSVFYYDNCLV